MKTLICLENFKKCKNKVSEFDDDVDDGDGGDDTADEDDIGNQLVERPPSFLFSLFFNLHRD